MAKSRSRANGEGTIFKRTRNGNTKWYAELVIGFEAGTGKKQVIRHTADTRRECADWLIDRQKDRNAGTLVKPTKETVETFLTDWLETTVSLEVKPRTLADYRFLVRTYILPHLGHIELQKLETKHIQALYHRAVTEGFKAKSRKVQKPLSPRTVELLHSVLHKGLQYAVDLDKLPRNPADKVKKPRVEKKQMGVLEPDQVIRFLEEIQKERLHALFILLVTCGLRFGEALGLRWSDVNLDTRSLTIGQTLTVIDNKLSFSTPKTKSSARTITLPEMTVAALRKWRKEQAGERLKAEIWEDTGLVFTTGTGTAISPHNIRGRVLRPLLKRAGLPSIRVHDLRHTAATLMLAQGVQTRVVQDVLGHSDIRTTLGTYAHVLKDQKEEAANKMDAFLSKQAQKNKKTGG